MNRRRFDILVLLISLTMVLTLSIDRTSVRASGELNTEPDDDYYIYLPLISGQPKPSSCTSDPAGESDNINDALTVCSGQTVSGQVSDADLEDVYKIWAEVNQQLTISMSGTGIDADLLLYPPSTTDVVTDPWATYSAGQDINEYIQYTIDERGFWYIDVYSQWGINNYNLTIKLSGP